MAYWNRELQRVHSPALRFAFPIVTVAVATAVAVVFRDFQLQGIELPILTMAIAMTTWYAGLGPCIAAVLLSIFCFDYFFTAPYYSLTVSTLDLPYFAVFIVWAGIVASFSTVRHRIEISLRATRDALQVELEDRKRREDEVRTLNVQLAKRAEELEVANKELEAFSYSVSHDLRAPLRHVVGYSELLQKRAGPSLDDQNNRYVKVILEAAKKMGVLIDDLLAFSRIGRSEAKKAMFDLGQVVKEVIADIEQETAGRDIVWDIGSLPVCYGDRALLKLVVANLLANAVKFTRARSPAKIEIGRVSQNEKEVEIFVKDNGAGFDMRYVDKLFGVFQRLHLTEEFEGTGIGLATIQRIIHRHGGTVRAEGVVEQGATFYFSLPDAQGVA